MKKVKNLWFTTTVKKDTSIFHLKKEGYECCDYSTVSGGNGCACVTDEQMKYLASRGGNRTNSSILSKKNLLDEF